MKIKNIKLRQFLRVAACCLLAVCLLAPMDAGAAKKRKRTTTTTTTTSKKKNTTTSTTKKKSTSTSKKKTSGTSKKKSTTSSASGSSRSARRASSTRTVTQKTSDVAKSASRKKTSSSKKNTGLRKFEVDKPDLEEIRVSTLNPSSKFYFPKLMEKYQHNDTTMTAEEYRYLYLGYMFQEDYDPYRLSPYSSMTDSLRMKATHTRAEIEKIREYATLALNDNPFDLRQMSFLVHVLKESRKDMSAKIWEYRLEHLLGAIKSTGTGEDEENAWFVIYPMHEYDIVQLMGYEAVDVAYIPTGFDYLKVEPDGSVKHRKPAEGFYFNVQVPQQQYELKHPEEIMTETVAADGDESGTEIAEDISEGEDLEEDTGEELTDESEEPDDEAAEEEDSEEEDSDTELNPDEEETEENE